MSSVYYHFYSVIFVKLLWVSHLILPGYIFGAYGKSSSFLKLPPEPLLPIDCLKYNLTGIACRNYISIFIFNFAGMSQTGSSVYDVPLQGYSTSVPAQDTIFYPLEYFNVSKEVIDSYGTDTTNVTSTTLNVYVGLQFDKIFGLDDVSATLKASVVLSVWWHDPRLTWNSSLTPIAMNSCADPVTMNRREKIANILFENNVRLHREYIWTPDPTIMNSASENSNFIDTAAGSENLLLYPTGLVNWRMKGNIETYCQLKLQWFPFDTQVCTVELSSRSHYLISGLNFSSLDTYLGFKDIRIFSPEFRDSVSWTTKSITVERIEQNLFGFQTQFQVKQSTLVYTVILQRNGKIYMTTAIIPNILVTCLSIGSLWITDYPSRLALTITALLTIIAILWSVSSSLPLTNTYSWMDGFLLLGIIIIASVILETCLVYYFVQQDEASIPPPQNKLIKLFIKFCKWKTIFCCGCLSIASYFNRNNKIHDESISSARSTNSATHLINTKKEVNDIEQKNMEEYDVNTVNKSEPPTSIPSETSLGVQSKLNHTVFISVEEKLNPNVSAASPILKATEPSIGIRQSYSSSNPQIPNEMNSPTVVKLDKKDDFVTWRKLCDAIDTLWQIVTIFTYFICLMWLIIEARMNTSHWVG